jgi:hypothetical protein
VRILHLLSLNARTITKFNRSSECAVQALRHACTDLRVKPCLVYKASVATDCNLTFRFVGEWPLGSLALLITANIMPNKNPAPQTEMTALLPAQVLLQVRPHGLCLLIKRGRLLNGDARRHGIIRIDAFALPFAPSSW